MTPRFRRRSTAPVRVTPVAIGAPPPRPGRAARAGFADTEGATAEYQTRHRRHLLVRHADDPEAAGATAAARLPTIPHLAIDARTLGPEAAASLAAGVILRAWHVRHHRTTPDPAASRLQKLDILVDHPKAARAAWAKLGPAVEGTLFARDLVAEPGNHLTPDTFARRLQPLAGHGIAIEVLRTPELRAGGFGGLLAVGQGSANPPCLVVLRWPGRTGAAPLLLVGKGITFDTGGISIKPAADMWDMRADMAGAAACAGAMLAIATRESPAAVTAVLALAENAIGAAAYRPGDVLRMQNGTTVEIVDTDAEGRLVLADALAWGIATERPLAVVDLATLTGSIVTALGGEMAGCFSNNDELAAAVARAAATANEPVWRMPLDDAYAEDLESDIADLRHCAEGRMQPDACHAAAFLDRFNKGAPWAHLDIAGTELNEKPTDRHPAGATGWGVRLLDQLTRIRFEN